MSRSRSHPPPGTKRSAKAPQWSLAKQLRLVLAVSVLVAAIAAIMIGWEQLSPIPPERLVKVYRTHGCRCAFAWAKSLESEGFVVRVFEYETLAYVRTSLHTPSALRGCHVGAYLGYFIEGHVSPDALRRLAAQHPLALGLATQEAANGENTHVSIARDASSGVLLVKRDGRAYPWLESVGHPTSRG
mgnify:CR=1 FL=1